MRRLRIELKGVVQGVGFRPFVFRLAKKCNLRGYVINDSAGVLIEVEGDKTEEFLRRLHQEKPPLARILFQIVEFLPPVGYQDFEIRESQEEGKKEVLILPDIAVCEDCLKEMQDPEDRRYRYPFINCTNCGPRFTIIETLPYDRPNTVMKVFRMCPECEREYEDPSDRRFHAQPIACPMCGPKVFLHPTGEEGEEALRKTIQALKNGRIVAVKGIGGFHLMCDALNEETVAELRRRKRRQEKPFAVMFKSLEQVEQYAELTELEKALIISPERPIVLVKGKGGLAPSVAPGLKRIGVFLPYSPLHHLILSSLDFPVVATSGNLSDEPIVKDNDEAVEKLSEFSDLILLHNRDIKRRCDDSVVKVVGDVALPIRRSRGIAPLPIVLPFKLKRKVLAVGGMLKNTFAIAFDDKVILSQHIGDVENLSTLEVFEESVKDFMELYEFEPDVVVYDLHPRYETTRWALSLDYPKVGIQHHFSHILSCMAENALGGQVFGIAWDGTGYGTDGTLWGGEFLSCDYTSFERLFHFKPFKLLGGEKAVKEPARVALSLLLELYGESALSLDLPSVKHFSQKELELLLRAYSSNLNAPLSSSVGRLFDGVASLLGVKQKINYEGQSAMMLEDMYDYSVKDTYPFEVKGSFIDWAPTVEGILRDRENPSLALSRFINTLAKVCRYVAKEVDIPKVCLSGGVMQNDPLVCKIKEELKSFEVYTHQRVPANDGGLSLGQAVYGGVDVKL